MLALVKEPNSSLNNPHQIECKLLDLLKGSSVQGLEPHVKAGVAETAAKVVAKLLAHNKEKQILTSKEQKMDWLNSVDQVRNLINNKKYENDLVYQLDIIKATVNLV